MESDHEVQLFELHYAGAKLIIREVEKALERYGYPAGRLGFALFLFNHSEERMIFYFSNVQHVELIDVCKGFICSWEDV